jgi:hypothetical protein
MRVVARFYFLGFFDCESADAIGPRSRTGVLGLRKSLPACEASRFDVVIIFLFVLIFAG